MSEEADKIAEEQGERLWAIDTQEDRGGMPLWPLFIVLLVVAFGIGGLMIPCVGLRIDYLRVTESPKMGFFTMECTKVGGACVCRQDATVVEGGYDCHVTTDLREDCELVAADSP